MERLNDAVLHKHPLAFRADAQSAGNIPVSGKMSIMGQWVRLRYREGTCCIGVQDNTVCYQRVTSYCRLFRATRMQHGTRFLFAGRSTAGRHKNGSFPKSIPPAETKSPGHQSRRGCQIAARPCARKRVLGVPIPNPQRVEKCIHHAAGRTGRERMPAARIGQTALSVKDGSNPANGVIPLPGAWLPDSHYGVEPLGQKRICSQGFKSPKTGSPSPAARASSLAVPEIHRRGPRSPSARRNDPQKPKLPTGR